MEGFKCEYCQAQEVRKTAHGRELPGHLAVHIQRTAWDEEEGREYKKLNDLIIDPSDPIDMSRWWPTCSPDTKYEVCAVVEHDGLK